MINEISTYLDLRFAEVNSSISGTTNDFIKTTILTELAENQKEKSYRLTLEDIVEMESEAQQYLVKGIVEVSFLIPNFDSIKYHPIIDTYVHALIKQIRVNSNYKYSSQWFLEVLKVSGGNLNKFNNEEFKCEITLDMRVVDKVAINTNVPTDPTLTSPIDTYSTGLLDQSFNWTGTADTWDFSLTLNGTTVIYQEGLTSSSFTVPLDSLLTNNLTYSWTARGRNAGGVGAWATARTFTTNDDPNPAIPTLDSPANGASGTGTETFRWSTATNATTYEIQIASDSGFTSIITTVTGLTKTYYTYTFSSSGTYYWRVRSTNGLGSSSYTSGRSVVETVPVSDYRTGLVAEWKSDSGVTSDENGVSAWVDTVGSLSASQGTTANKPFYSANQLNGKPVIRFTTSRWLTFSSTALTNYTIIITYKASSFQAGNSNYLLAGSGLGIFSSINALGIGYGEFDGTRIRAVTYNGSDTTWHIRSFQNSKMYSNGTEPSYSNTQNMTGLTLTTIGTRGDNTTLYFSGDVANIRIYSSVLSTTDRATAETYLNSIYAIY